MIEKTPLMLIDEFPDFNVEGFDMESYNQRFYNSNVIIKAKTRQVAYDEHWGPLSIKCVWSGKEFYKTQNRLITVEPTTYVVFNEGLWYSSYIESREEVESFTINFTPQFTNQVVASLIESDDYNLANPTPVKERNVRFSETLNRHGATVTPHLLRLNQLSKAFLSNEVQIEEEMYTTLFSLMLDQPDIEAQMRSVNAVKSSTKVEIYRRLNRVREFIFSSFKQNIGLGDMAEVACLNQYYLLRQFKKLFGVTPHQLLTERRLLEAKRLLTTTNKTILDVCNECGFADQASFSKLFKKYFQVAPGAYRASQ